MDIQVKDFVRMEKSGAIFRVVNASDIGYMNMKNDKYIIDADRNVVANVYGECELIGFQPKGKKVILYVKIK